MACAFLHNGISLYPAGRMKPCCRFGRDIEGVRLTDITSALHSPFLADIRRRANAGEKIPECRKCDEEEAVGKISLRQRAEGMFSKSEPPILEVLDVAFSNHCNLACRFCNGDHSSSIALERTKRGEPTRGVLLENDIDYASVDLSKLRVLNILGGEPFVQEKKLIPFLEHFVRTHPNPESVSVTIMSNGTRRPSGHLLALLLQLRFCAFCFSIDAMGGLNDYLRHGSVFDEIVANVDYFHETFRGHPHRFAITTAVSAFNIHYVEELASFVAGRWPDFKHRFHLVHDPIWFSLSSLPLDERKRLSARFVENDPTGLNLAQALLRDGPEDIVSMRSETAKLDQYRGENLALANPELFRIIGQ